MRRVKGATLLEAIVAAVLFLIVFAAAMELIPRLAVRDDEAALLTEADYRVMQAFGKYATGVWPCGYYSERYGWGEVTVRISPYREFEDMQQIDISARIDGSSRPVGFRQIISLEE